MNTKYAVNDNAEMPVRITDPLRQKVAALNVTVTDVSASYETPTVVEVTITIKPSDGEITVTDVDTTAPTVSLLSPLDDATGVDPDAALVMTFDENMQLGDGDIKLYKTSDDSLVESINVKLGSVVIADNVVTITRGVTLANSTEYYVLINSGALKDLSGNAYAGITSTTDWSFTTSA